MISPEVILNQIEKINAILIEEGYSKHQNFSFIKNYNDNFRIVTWQTNPNLSSTFNETYNYKNVYDIYKENKNYTILLIDDAILQISYEFKKNTLMKHRLAFFPSPYLEEFQNNRDIYEVELFFSEIINKGIVPTPVRFDYDKDSFKELNHPKSHMTVGQYKNCRIPVRSALTPFQFINFILNNFYCNILGETELYEKCNQISFGSSITAIESSFIHLNIEI